MHNTSLHILYLLVHMVYFFDAYIEPIEEITSHLKD